MMKTSETNINQYFAPLLHKCPWKVKLGHGSFLTFEFGRRVKDRGHVHGEWHLWVYQSNWELLHGSRQLANSDSDRRVISVSVRRLEDAPLNKVSFEPADRRSTFVFGDFRLVVSPADYLDRVDDRDEYWLLFMPNKDVLSVGPAGIQVERSDIPHYA
jgi:hypothetical protein